VSSVGAKPKPKLSYFFIENTRFSTSSEGLNSSLAQSVAALWLTKAYTPWENRIFGVILKFVQNFDF